MSEMTSDPSSELRRVQSLPLNRSAGSRLTPPLSPLSQTQVSREPYTPIHSSVQTQVSLAVVPAGSEWSVVMIVQKL